MQHVKLGPAKKKKGLSGTTVNCRLGIRIKHSRRLSKKQKFGKFFKTVLFNDFVKNTDSTICLHHSNFLFSASNYRMAIKCFSRNECS